MPCQNDYGTPEMWMRDLSIQQNKTNDLARMLCDIAQHLEDEERSDLFASVPGFKTWWMTHKKRDAEEQERQRIKLQAEIEAKHMKEVAAEALKKLTSEERKALGV